MPPRALAACLFALLMSARSMRGQNFEASGNGGYGVAERDGGGNWVPSGGVTFGWPYTSAHKV
jgi:hypothetical protein